MEDRRRRITLYEQMTAVRRDSLASLFLNDVVLPETATGSSTTLLDIIKEDKDEDEDEGNNKNNTKDRKSWKAFRDFLRLKRTEPVRSSTVHSDIPPHTNNNNNNNDSDSYSYSNRITLLSQFSQQQQQNDVVEEDSINNHHGPADVAVAEPPGNMLLMDLLEETDPETELMEGSGDKMSDDDDEEEEEKCGVENNNKWCCVCMVRDKGAAFIPCGHTFCRMCCREIWVSRGNCPLCNNFILEILHLF